jgi:beta-glucosidase
MSARPLYEFGHGLSYTTFEYRNLQVGPKVIGPAGEVEVAVDIANSGQRDGEETVQLYVSDVVASVSRPVLELRGFQKITLKRGEVRTVKFKLVSEDLSFLDASLHRVVESGKFRVLIGHSSSDIRLTGEFEVR